MRVPRVLSVVLAACAAAALSATAAPAASSPEHPAVRGSAGAKAAPDAGLRGIGRQITPRVDTGLYSAPGLSTPRSGTAWAGHNVAGICYDLDNNGKPLVLGIDRPGRNGVQWANTAGYIWAADIVDGTNGLPSCDGYGTGVDPRIDTGLYSGPGLSTPLIGTAWAWDDVAGICKINDNNGKRLVLGIERPGRNGVQWANSVGYIWDDHIYQVTNGLPDCGTQ